MRSVFKSWHLTTVAISPLKITVSHSVSLCDFSGDKSLNANIIFEYYSFLSLYCPEDLNICCGKSAQQFRNTCTKLLSSLDVLRPQAVVRLVGLLNQWHLNIWATDNIVQCSHMYRPTVVEPIYSVCCGVRRMWQIDNLIILRRRATRSSSLLLLCLSRHKSQLHTHPPQPLATNETWHLSAQRSFSERLQGSRERDATLCNVTQGRRPPLRGTISWRKLCRRDAQLLSGLRAWIDSYCVNKWH